MGCSNSVDSIEAIEGWRIKTEKLEAHLLNTIGWKETDYIE
jgi:hypothetical protein